MGFCCRDSMVHFMGCFGYFLSESMFLIYLLHGYNQGIKGNNNSRRIHCY